MGYSGIILSRAKERLEALRIDHESMIQARLQEIYKELPRVKQIDLQLRQSMTLAVQAAFAKGTDARVALEQIKDANLALQREREELILERFDRIYLDEGPVCKSCSGIGFTGEGMCECLRKLCAQEQKKQFPTTDKGEARFEDFSLEYYSAQPDRTYGASHRAIMKKNYEACRRFAYSFGSDSGNLLLSGSTGLGKTFLSACIANMVTDRGFSVCYETASHLFEKLEQERFSPSEEAKEAADQLRRCDLLILDDLGTEMTGQFVIAALYSLINDRLNAGKPMLISTNLNVDEIAKRYTPQIASRIQGQFERRTFVGEDIRVKKGY